MSVARSFAVAFVSAALFSGQSSFEMEPPVADAAPSAGVLAGTPLADGWTRWSVELEAASVDLGHLGMHTHANWVVFELPFDTRRRDLRNVHLSPRALADTDVAALHTPIGCLPAPTVGPVEGPGWPKYTLGGIAGTRPLYVHGLAPTHDARAYAINVPTRVANVAACGAHALLSRSTWRLRVEWDSRTP